MTIRDALQGWTWAVCELRANWRDIFPMLAIPLAVLAIVLYAYAVALANIVR